VIGALDLAEHLVTRLGRAPLVKTSASEEKWEMIKFVVVAAMK
jgi:hypothetical protein